MKKRIPGLVIALLLILPVWISCGGKYTERPGKALEAANLFPEHGDIQGWKPSGEMLNASNEMALYKYIDGGAGLYVKHGFKSYAGKLYEGPKGLILEIAIYDQGCAKNARELYDDPFLKPNPSKMLEGLGDEARLDERALFHHSVEFIKDRFFVRVIIQDKSEEGLNIAIRFALYAAERIK